MDIFNKCFQYTDAKEAMAAGIYPYFIPLTENEGSEAEYQGQRLIMCGSNNYLGLTTHPKVREAAIQAINRFGTSCTGSRFLNGTLELHEHLEHELAEWVGKPSALVFSTGMQVNLGVISALVYGDEYIILDKDDHASIVDGALLSRGEMRRFRHQDYAALESLLNDLQMSRGRMVVVDGLYSMGGDIVRLPELVDICKKYSARLMVDDAHAMGVLGGGRGTATHFGLTEKVDLIMSTFSKSFASLGGFIAGDSDVIHYIKHHARSLIFSASIPPANAAAALAALHVMKDEPERITRLNEIGAHMRNGFTQLGFNIGESESPIVPIIIGDQNKTFLTWKLLFDQGVFVNAVVAPGVPAGKQLLRTSYMATHTDEQLTKVLDIFEKVGKQVGLI